MILATFLLTKVEVGAKVEAALQNFAAGLIISAGKIIIQTSSFSIIFFRLLLFAHSFISCLCFISCR